MKKASASGDILVVFEEGSIGVTFKEVTDKVSGVNYIAVSGIKEVGQAKNFPNLKLGQHLMAIGTNNVEGMKLQNVIQILQKTPRPVELTLKKDDMARVELLNQMNEEIEKTASNKDKKKWEW